MSIKMRILILFYSLVFLLTSSYTLAQRNYQSYTNDRFHFSIDYPANLFTPGVEPTNSDGRTFSNDEASLTAWGNFFLEDIYADMQAVLDSATENYTITYQLVDDDFFVASGLTPEGNVFYRRADLLDGVVYNFLLEYPQEMDFVYDEVTTQVANSYTLPIASYDCDLASTESEKLICDMPRLSLYDARIAKSYSYLQETLASPYAEQLKAQQREWLQRRDACNTLNGETIFVCHSEEMFSRAEYLSVIENMQEDFTQELSYGLVEDPACETALAMNLEAFIEKNSAYANLPYSSHVNHWSYCLGQQALLDFAFTSSEVELQNIVQLRNTLIDLMGAYNSLRQWQAGGGSMYIMLYANAHQWVESEIAYILDSYKSNPNSIPEHVLKRAGLGLNATEADKFSALEAASTALENRLEYIADYRIDCCQENLDPYYLEEFKETLELATADIKTNLEKVNVYSNQLDTYLAHEFRALADDMFFWFDVR